MNVNTIAEWFARHRALLAGVLAAITALTAFGASRLGFDDNPRAVFRSDSEDFRRMEEVFDQFGTDENNCFLLVESDRLFTNTGLDELRRLTESVADLPGVESTTSLVDPRLVVFDPIPRPLAPSSPASDADLKACREAALSHPLVAGHLLDDTGTRTVVRARLQGDELTISQIQPIDEGLQQLAAQFTDETSLSVLVTGIPPIRATAFNLVRSESERFTGLCSAAALVMAILILRRWQMVLVVCLAAMTGALWTIGLLGLFGENMTVLTVVLPTLVLVVGFTDSVHLLVDVRFSRASGLAPLPAAREAVRHLTVACALTSFTTAVGFASLVVTRTEIVRRFGLACGMGAVVTFVAVITMTPLLASTRLGSGMLPPTRGRSFDTIAGRCGARLTDALLRHRWLITAAAVLAVVPMTYTVLQLEPENEISETLPDNANSTVALRAFDEHFGGVLPSFVLVEWPESVDVDSAAFTDVLNEVHTLCEASPATNHPFSILNVARAVPAVPLSLLPESATASLLRTDLRRTVVVSRGQDRGSRFYAENFPRLRAQLTELETKHPGFRFHLTGSSVVASRLIDQMITDLVRSLGLAMIVIFVTLSVVFRSVRIGLICLIPNALPLLLTGCLLVWTGESLRFAGVIVFCVCLGIAVDDTIHLVNRFQRELRVDGNVDAALRRSVRAVGLALLITTLVLVVGFSVTLTSDVPGNRMFGWLSCTAVSSALLGDLVILPAMLACFVRAPNVADDPPVVATSESG